MVVVLLAILCDASLLNSIGSCQEQKLPVPENVGVFYYLDPLTNSLIALERQVAVTKKRGGLVKSGLLAQIKGEKAAIRIKSGESLGFVVDLPNGVDPIKYQLISLDVKKGQREVILYTRNKFTLDLLPFTVSRFGSVYKFTPSQILPPGEYSFSPPDSNDAFCFGIDAAQQDAKKNNF